MGEHETAEHPLPGRTEEAGAHLLAAGRAACDWAHARRATWTDRPLPPAQVLRPRATEPHWPSPHTAISPSPAYASIAPPRDRAALASPAFPVVPDEDVERACGAHEPLKRWARRVVLAWMVIAFVGAGWTMRARWSGWFTPRSAPTAAETAPPPDSRAPDIASNPPPTPTGSLQVRSNPDGARVTVDGQARGAAPVTIDSLAAGPHTVILESGDGTMQRDVQVTAGNTTEIEEAIFPGWMSVLSTVELQVSEGGRAIGLNDAHAVLLPAGPHDLRFENRTLGYMVTRRVLIKPGETTAISIVPGKSRLTISASLPAEVLVDGVRAGETPLSDYPVDVGTREITIRSLTGIERRTTVTVGAQPARLDVDFTRSP